MHENEQNHKLDELNEEVGQILGYDRCGPKGSRYYE